MAITRSRVEKCLSTISSIVSSPSIDQYLIGFTSLSCQEKGDQYRNRVDFDHLVILADKMNQRDALILENKLQTVVWSDPSTTAYKKYHEKKLAKGRTYESAGGTPRDPTSAVCSVYLAWWDK